LRIDLFQYNKISL